MESDLSIILRWWFYILLMGLVFFPAVKQIFDKFFDKGYLFSKTAAVSVISYTVWLLSSLRIAPFHRITIAIVIFAAFIIIHIIKKGYIDLVSTFKEKRSIIITEEILFLSGLLFWCYIRGLQPDIYGLEKYMDYGFVNSILRTDYMPPQDIWLAGRSINYYYFGHFICALLTKLTVVESSIAYNIMMATVFSFAFSLTFSLGGNIVHLLEKQGMKKIVAAGIISSMLLTFGGNLHAFVFAQALPFAKNIGLYKGNVEKYFYADATRYIGYNPVTNDKTIHEFPFYSFVVADLHGHVSDIPFIITILAVILAFVCKGIKKKLFCCIASFMLAVFYMTNGWDFPIYLTVVLFALLCNEIEESGLTFKSIKKAFVYMIIVFALSQVVLLFYTLNFKNITGGIGIVHSQTPLYQIFILWGYQFFITSCFLIFASVKSRNAVISEDECNLNIKKYQFFAGLARTDIYILILLVSAMGLVIIPEIVYVKDIYGPEYHRANTMFKLVYQSFIMFGISAGYVVVRIVSNINKGFIRKIALVIFALVLMLPMVYPYYAVKGYYGSIKTFNYKGLYGLDFLKKSNPGDYEAVKWLRNNIKGRSVVLEANGEGYSDYERISMATGLPTVLGWFGHEWLWRGGSQIPTERGKEVETIYESEDESITKQLLNKYDVSYIVIGRLEREKFKNIKEDKLLKLGEVVFGSLETKIIKVGR